MSEIRKIVKKNFESISTKCNDDLFLPSTEAINIHEEFEESFVCYKGYFEWTKEKAKDFLQKIKKQLNEIITRYEASGNGSNMLDSEAENSDGEREVYLSRSDVGRKWGRFNKERADRVYSRKNDFGNIKDGDDSKAFIRHYPPDILYFWWAFDKFELIHFTIGEIDSDIAASSMEVPSTFYLQ